MKTMKHGGRLSGLEVLRGIAAVSIIVFHLMMIHVPLPPGGAQNVINSLSGAVPLFFAVSAFSLLYGYRDRIFDEGALHRFYMRRIFRIMPLFYVMLTIYVTKSTLDTIWISNSEILINILFLFPFFPGKHESLVWAGWSLGVEWCFYVLFPLFALISRGWKSSAIAFLSLCAVSLAAPRIVADLGLERSFSIMNIPRNLLFFQCGVFIFSLIRHLDKIGRSEVVLSKLKEKANLILLLTLGALAIHQFVRYRYNLHFAVPTELLLAGVCCILISLAYAGLPSWIDNKSTRFLGKISYGTYLVHPLILWLLTDFGIYKTLNENFTNSYFGFAACALVSIIFVIIIAETAFRLVEAPGIALGDRILNKLKNRNTGILI